MFKGLISFKTLLWITSIILAVCSAGFSVFGLSKLFAGASLAVIIMAATLEFAKLITVTFVHNYYKDIKLGMRTYLLSASAVLMIITSLGVYGFLTNAYQLALKSYSENQINAQFIEKNKELITKEIQYIEKDQATLSQRLQSYDKIRIDQESAVINSKTKTTNVQRNIKATSKISDDINKKLEVLADRKNKLSDSLMSLEKQTLNIDVQNNQTELGPLIYISRLTGYSMDQIVNIFVLIITLVFDPLAIALLLAANFLSKLTAKKIVENPIVFEDKEDKKINLENTEKNDILSDSNINESNIKNEEAVENVNNIEVDALDEFEFTSNVTDEALTEEDKFYEVETNKFDKHPWKVGF